MPSRKDIHEAKKKLESLLEKAKQYPVLIKYFNETITPKLINEHKKEITEKIDHEFKPKIFLALMISMSLFLVMSGNFSNYISELKHDLKKTMGTSIKAGKYNAFLPNCYTTENIKMDFDYAPFLFYLFGSILFTTAMSIYFFRYRIFRTFYPEINKSLRLSHLLEYVDSQKIDLDDQLLPTCIITQDKSCDDPVCLYEKKMTSNGDIVLEKIIGDCGESGSTFSRDALELYLKTKKHLPFHLRDNTNQNFPRFLPHKYKIDTDITVVNKIATYFEDLFCKIEMQQSQVEHKIS